MPNITIPGLDALGCGYDVFGRYANARSCKRKLFDLGENDQEVAIEQPAPSPPKSYWRPAAVEVVRAYETYFRVAWGESIEEYQASLGIETKLGGGYAGFTASVSSSFNKTERTKLENAFCTLRNVIQYYTLRLPAVAQLRRQLQPDVRLALESMDPAELFDTYGTHFVSSLVAGAHADYTCVTNKNLYSSSTSLDVAVRASYLGVVSASVDVKTKKTVEQFRSASDIRIQAFGGRPELASGLIGSADGGWKTYAEWLASVPAALVFSDFVDDRSLLPIWNLVADAPRRAALEAAFGAYCREHEPLEGPRDIEMKVTSKFVPVARDPGFKNHLSTYVPALPSGWYGLGQYAQGNQAAPDGQAVIVRDRSAARDALRPPTGFVRLWAVGKTLSCWRPVAPEGYVALGHLFKNGDTPPDATDLMCVRRDLVTRGTIGARIWDVPAGPVWSSALTVYRIDTVDDDAVGAGTFFAWAAPAGTPPGPQMVHCLIASGRPAARTVQAITRRLRTRLRADQKAGKPFAVRVPMPLKGLKIGPRR